MNSGKKFQQQYQSWSSIPMSRGISRNSRFQSQSRIINYRITKRLDARKEGGKETGKRRHVFPYTRTDIRFLIDTRIHLRVCIERWKVKGYFSSFLEMKSRIILYKSKILYSSNWIFVWIFLHSNFYAWKFNSPLNSQIEIAI